MTHSAYSFTRAAQALLEAGVLLDARGWVPATSGNFSVRLDNGEIALTVSGRHKGRLTTDDIMRIDAQAQPLDGKTPSAETLLHTQLYAHYPDVHCVLHVHAPAATLISRLQPRVVKLENYELLKAFTGITTHATQVRVPVFDNDQDIARLADNVQAWFADKSNCPGYLINSHGLYAWGDSVETTLRHLEAFDFLFRCELALQGPFRE